MAPQGKKRRLSKDALAGDKPAKTAPDSEMANSKQSRSLFVRSLPANTTTEDLTEHFSQSYPIKHAVAVIDRDTKECKGYGFVTFADIGDAQRAQEEINGSTFLGQKIRVEVAKPRHRDENNQLQPVTGETGSTASTRLRAGGKTQDEKPQSTKLIIRNLPWSIKKPEQLAALFQSYGKIKHADLPSKKPGTLSGFGFVVMRGRKNAEKALAGVNGKEVDGRTLAVDWAVDKTTWQGLAQLDKDEVESDDALQEDVDGDEGASDGSPKSEVCSNEDENEWETEIDDEDVDSTQEQPSSAAARPPEDFSATLFIRNVPFTCSEEDLEDHFSHFGKVRYARLVIDPNTERPRGTAFVRFLNVSDADTCVKGAPQATKQRKTSEKDSMTVQHSILQDEFVDPTGDHTLDGRILQVSRAVDRSEASKLTQEGVAHRKVRDKDKRRLYLLSEGTIPSNSPLYQKLSPAEINMRDASMKQRKSLIESNPSLHLSLTRLSVRNIPRSVTSKHLKALAREAVVGFAKDAKAGRRQQLSKEELQRGGDEMRDAERERKKRGKGLVKQAKVVFEGSEGGKVPESSGAGRSRGYGFIEYYTHRSALMGLRWLNGHALMFNAAKQTGKISSKSATAEKNKRLIVEFAIENVQVVSRRKARESTAKERAQKDPVVAKTEIEPPNANAKQSKALKSSSTTAASGKRKRPISDDPRPTTTKNVDSLGKPSTASDEKLAKRQKIISRKRMMRKSRKRDARA